MILVAAGEMAVQRVDREALERADLGGPQSQPVDAGVDHYVARMPGRDLLPSRHLFDGVEARPCADAQR